MSKARYIFREKPLAAREFSATSNPDQIFWKAYEKVSQGEYRVLSFYGSKAEGVHSTLIRDIQKREKLQNGDFIPYAKLDLRDVCEKLDISLSDVCQILRDRLSTYECIFPLFDFGIRFHSSLTGEGEFSSQAFADVERMLENRQTREIADIRRILQGMVQASDPEETEEILPLLFAQDIQDWLSTDGRKLVIFLYHWDVLETSGGKKDMEFPGNKGVLAKMMSLLSNTLWVISGNHRPEPKEGDESFLLGVLSCRDADRFLKESLIVGKILREGILQMADGIPMYLDMAVDLFDVLWKRRGKLPRLEDFGSERKHLIEEFLRTLDDETVSMASCLALMGHWTDDMAEKMLPVFDADVYRRKIMRLPFLHSEEGGSDDRQVKEWYFEREVQDILCQGEEGTGTISHAAFEERLGLLKKDLGDYREAYRLLKSAVEAFHKILGKCHPDSLRSMRNLSDVAQVLGYRKESIELLEELIEIRKETRADAEDLMADRKQLAFRYREMHREEQTLRILMEILEDQKMVARGQKREKVLSAMGDVADSLEILGRREEAEKFKLEILSRRQEELSNLLKGLDDADEKGLERAFFLGDELWTILSFFSDNPEDWWKNNKEALKAKRAVADLYRNKLGMEHERTLEVLEEWAQTLTVASTDEAWRELVTVRKEILEARRKFCGEEDERTIEAMIQLADALMDWADRPQEAIAVLDEVLSIRQRMVRDSISYYGEADENTIHGMESVIELLDRMERREEAISLRKDIIALRENSLGFCHEKTIVAIKRCIWALDRAEEDTSALAMERDLLRRMGETFGQADPRTVEVMEELAWRLEDMEQGEEALVLLREVLTFRRKRYEKRDIASTVYDVANLLASLERYEEELPLRKEYLSLQQEIYGADSSEADLAKVQLADAEMAMGQEEEALRLWEQIADVRAKNLGEDSADALFARHGTAYLLCRMGRCGNALEREEETVEICRRNEQGVDHPLLRKAVCGRSICRVLLRMEGIDGERISHLREKLLSLFCWRDWHDTMYPWTDFDGLETRQVKDVLSSWGEELRRTGYQDLSDAFQNEAKVLSEEDFGGIVAKGGRERS